MAINHLKNATGSDGSHAERTQPSDWNAAHKVTGSKGDLLSFSAADTLANLGIGSDYAVLQADSGEAAGLKWGPTSGSWTPGVTFATPGDLAVVYSTQEGRYIRVGNMVTCWGWLATSSFTHTTAAGLFRITGLPFTIVNTTNDIAFGNTWARGWTLANVSDLILYGANNSTYLNVGASRSGAAITWFQTGHVLTGGTNQWGITITYEVA